MSALTEAETDVLGPFIWGGWIGVAAGREAAYSQEMRAAVARIKTDALATHHAAILTELHALARTDLVGRKSLHDAIAVVERLTPERGA